MNSRRTGSVVCVTSRAQGQRFVQLVVAGSVVCPTRGREGQRFVKVVEDRVSSLFSLWREVSGLSIYWRTGSVICPICKIEGQLVV